METSSSSGSSASLTKNYNLTPLIEYLDNKIGKWWEKPEVTNALLTDRKYHLTHLELMRVGTLSVTDKFASTATNVYGSGSITVFDFYREKYDIELQHSEMPLFNCDDGTDRMYPAEVIMLEIGVSPFSSQETPFDGKSCRSKSLITFLEDVIGDDWLKDQQLVGNHLKNIDFYLTNKEKLCFGSLTISSKLPSLMMKYNDEVISYQDWFKKTQNYTIKNTALPLITVNTMERKKFHWPAELIFIVIY